MTAHGGIRALVLASAFALFPSPAAAQTVHDGSTVLVSRPSGDAPYTGRRDGTSDALAVSADGRYVVFVSSIDEIADGVNLEEPALLLRDRVAQTTVLVGRSDGAVGAAASTPPSFGFSNPTAAVAVASAGSVPAEPLAFRTSSSPSARTRETSSTTPRVRSSGRPTRCGSGCGTSPRRRRRSSVAATAGPVRPSRRGAPRRASTTPRPARWSPSPGSGWPRSSGW